MTDNIKEKKPMKRTSIIVRENEQWDWYYVFTNCPLTNGITFSDKNTMIEYFNKHWSSWNDNVESSKLIPSPHNTECNHEHISIQDKTKQ